MSLPCTDCDLHGSIKQRMLTRVWSRLPRFPFSPLRFKPKSDRLGPQAITIHDFIGSEAVASDMSRNNYLVVPRINFGEPPKPPKPILATSSTLGIDTAMDTGLTAGVAVMKSSTLRKHEITAVHCPLARKGLFSKAGLPGGCSADTPHVWAQFLLD